VTILLARDSPVYRHLIAGHLNEWSFDFVCAKDGRASWGLLTKPDSPKLALLDWVLPGLDGVELCRRLRTNRKLNPAPIRFYSPLRVKNTRCWKRWTRVRMTTSRRANLIRELISSAQIRTPAKPTTVSMGVAVAESATSSCVARGPALYQAKRNGRNRVEETVATAGATVGRA
jgi:PleD family two-component response regulator